MNPTQKFSGRGQLVNRLAAQMGSRKAAITMLKRRGHMNPDGTLTHEGLKRDAMSAEERAKDRASTRAGRSSGVFTYDPRVNRVQSLKGMIPLKGLKSI